MFDDIDVCMLDDCVVDFHTRVKKQKTTDELLAALPAGWTYDKLGLVNIPFLGCRAYWQLSRVICN